ncbi:MAG: DUF1194 domain-containing protein [Rubritepida sp.]|nr:DUF1194 domain-containing protein [Rubritepida sp.]
MIACAVALVLLMDASASILHNEWTLQRDATAAAFRDPQVLAALERDGGVAVTAIAFSDAVTTIVPWRHLRDGADAARFADELAAAPRGAAGGTDIGAALFAGMAALAEAPCTAEQEVMDLATDGEAHEAPVHQARAYAEAQGVRINALGVGAPEAAEWLRTHAITPGGFALGADSWADFPRAIRRKLTMELAAR